MRTCLLWLLLPACGGGSDAIARGCEPVGDQLIADGDFDDGLDCWLYLGDGEATVVEESAPGGTAPELRLDASATGNEDYYNAELVSTPVSVSDLDPLVVGMWVRSGALRTVRIRLESFPEGGGEPTQGSRAYDFNLPIEGPWEEVRLTFAASDDMTDGRLKILMGDDSDAPVWIDRVTLSRDE